MKVHIAKEFVLTLNEGEVNRVRACLDAVATAGSHADSSIQSRAQDYWLTTLSAADFAAAREVVGSLDKATPKTAPF